MGAWDKGGAGLRNPVGPGAVARVYPGGWEVGTRVQARGWGQSNGAGPLPGGGAGQWRQIAQTRKSTLIALDHTLHQVLGGRGTRRIV